MNYFFKKAGLFIKTNWKVIALCVITLAGYLLFKRAERGFTEQLREIKKIHAEEIKKIEQIRAEERALHEENERLLRDALAVVQQEYEKAKIELSESKKKEVKKIVNEIGKDPMALAQKLSEATGIKIILPEDWGKK